MDATERWAREDAELREFCLHGQRLTSDYWLRVMYCIPSEVENEWNDAVEAADDMPSRQAAEAIMAAARVIHEDHAVETTCGGGPLTSSGKQNIDALLVSHHLRARRFFVESTLTKSEWLRVFDAFGGNCAYCRQPARTVDHVTPMSRGGSNSMGNVVPACWPCNVSKNVSEVTAWLVNRGQGRVTETLERMAACQARAGAT